MLFVGSPLDRAPGRKYVAALRFAQLTLRAPLPRPATLASWRAALPEDFALALRAPRAALISQRGPLRIDAGIEAALAVTLEAAQALAVRALVLPTPADFAPGPRSREVLSAFVDKLPRVAGRHYVWAPSGVWEPEEADPLCAQLGLVRAFDPLQTQRPPGAVVYAELRALGHRSGFSLAALEDALSVIESEDTSEAFLLVDAQRSFEIAKRLAPLAQARGMAAAFGPALASRAAGDERAGRDEALDDEDEDDDDDDEDGVLGDDAGDVLESDESEDDADEDDADDDR